MTKVLYNRHECMILDGINTPFRILHISDVHFSRHTSHEQNQLWIAEILRKANSCTPIDVIAVTGDLISRCVNEYSIPDALALLTGLKQIAPVIYSLGNHEKDFPEAVLTDALSKFRNSGVHVLDNSSVSMQNIQFTGLTLPQTVYKNPNGAYFDLDEITLEMLSGCIGKRPEHPCILLAHSPMGLKAYAQWGADLVLSGHVHGGAVRIPGIGGLLSPERKFFPKYAKGIYRFDSCVMNVSAGIGKFRLNNPPELICIDLIPPGKEDIS